MSFQDSYVPFPRPHEHSHDELPTPPPRYSGYRDPSTPHGLGPGRRPGTGSSTGPLPLLPVQAVQSSIAEKELPSPPAAPVSAAPLPVSQLNYVPPNPDPEVFPFDLPPRPARVQSRLARLPIRFYISPRPRVNQYDQNIELGTLPTRRDEVRRREDLVSPELPRGNVRQRSGLSVRWSESWWRVMCSVKVIVGLAIVVAFWVFIILGATGKVTTVV
ncbi:hypothetical protein BKA63DRAFT_571365 [Paraphoma chrysanthemicola]|nr:hypothetical protein BKA63DRAFT_571365 [Paraphoma chrysanthemicola]